MFKGSIVALVTPFKNGEVDYEKFRELIKFHLNNETDGVVVAGTTGEAPTLTDDEKSRLFKIAEEMLKGKLPFIAGTGTNDTAHSIKLTKMALEQGADAALIVIPYYNRPNQNGIIAHFDSIYDNTKLPLILYNVPGRTGINASPDTISKIYSRKKIVAVKQAIQNIDEISELSCLCDVPILAGDDSLTLPMMSVGGVGVISVTANILPKKMSAMCRSFLQGKYDEAQKIHFELFEINKLMFIESNPIPVKTAMKLIGMINGEMRLPLYPMSKENEEKLKSALYELKLL